MQYYNRPRKQSHKQSRKKQGTSIWGGPWWQDLLFVPGASFAFLIVGSFGRAIVGLPNGSDAWYHVATIAWFLYIACWLVFVVIGHNKQDYAKYFPYSTLIVAIAIIATWLIP